MFDIIRNTSFTTIQNNTGLKLFAIQILIKQGVPIVHFTTIQNNTGLKQNKYKVFKIIFIKTLEVIPIWAYNISILKERINVMDIVKDTLSITKDLERV